MVIIGLTLAELQSAARDAGAFRLDNVRTKTRRDGRPEVGFVLRMANPVPSKKVQRDDPDHDDLTYRKRGFGGGGRRWTGAVCFHGHKRFMDRVFADKPDAVIRTKFATYRGAEDFAAKWVGVGMTNAGSMMYPEQYREQCDCYGN